MKKGTDMVNQVDNDKLGQSHIPYIVYTSSKSSTSKDEGKWPEGWSLQKEGTEKAVLGLIRGEERVFRDIVDFDDHLEDP